MKKVIAIYRAEKFSPNSVEKDKAIMDAVCSRLQAKGHETTAVKEEQLGECGHADMILTMGRLSSTLNFLEEQQRLGTTPYNYLVNFRITQAKELLVLTDHSVSEIAQEVGFGDASNFSTRFVKATGQSPLQYRKSALKSAGNPEQD